MLAGLAAGVGVAAVAGPAGTTLQEEPASQPGRALTVLITGANRGLGLEFARQFSAAGSNVIGTARHPDEAEELKSLGVRVEKLDVTDSESVARLAAILGDEPVDILINNAGIGGRELSIDGLDVDALDRFFQVNTLGPMRVTQALLPALRKGDRKLVVNITSMLGSLERNTWGGAYGYRESKAALNMFTRSLAIELKDDGFTCIVMNPGWVRTRMGGTNARLSPQESISAMIGVIDKLTPQDTGQFFSYTGERQPW